jgi:hypothetical protein
MAMPVRPTPEQSLETARHNDNARRGMDRCHAVDSAGFAMLPLADRREITSLVARYDDWDDASNPYDEHDFGIVYLRKCGGWTTGKPEPGTWDHAIFWKFDYRDARGRGPALTPWDKASTIRVLTFLLPEEYGSQS